MISRPIIYIFSISLIVLIAVSLFNQTTTTASYQPSPTLVPTSTPSPRPSPTQIPLPQVRSSAPEVTAKSFIIQDLGSNTILAQKDPAHVLPPASTTKIMTALIALDNYPLDDIAIMPNQQVIGAKIGLHSGEQITIENLLYGMLMQSGNDAAWTLASHFEGGIPAFIEAMNQKAIELGLEQTHFVNPTGLHHPLHLSSTLDLIKLSQQALSYPEFAQIVATKQKIISDVSGENKHKIVNLNQLLTSVPGVKGVKTGWTEQAREALVTLVEQQQHPLLIAVLASEDRFGDTEKLINWIYQNTSWNNQ